MSDWPGKCEYETECGEGLLTEEVRGEDICLGRCCRGEGGVIDCED